MNKAFGEVFLVMVHEKIELRDDERTEGGSITRKRKAWITAKDKEMQSLIV
jgi:hypothetical protein